jgi:hypothetical protein
VHWSRYDAPNGALVGQATQDNLPFGPEAGPGQYYYSVECVANGQQGPSHSFTFTVNPKPGLTLFSRINDQPFGTPTTQSLCEGGLVAFGRDRVPVPAGYTLQWRGPNGSASPVNQDWDVNNITPAQGGAYTYTVTDDKGCSTSASINVEVRPRPNMPITYVAANNSGFRTDRNQYTVGQGSVLVLGRDYIGGPDNKPLPGYNLVWTGPNNTSVNGQDGDWAIESFQANHAGVYTFQVTNPSGCTNQNSVTLDFLANPAPVLSASPSSILAGGSSVLSASGCGGTVTWSTGEVGPTSITVSPTQTTTYQAICTLFPSSGGWAQSPNTSITVTVGSLGTPTAPTFNGGSNAFTGQGTEVTFASSCPSGGQVHWSRYDAPNGTRIGEAFGSTLLFGGNSPAGPYYYSVECVANGQQGPARTFTFTVNSKPTFGFTAAGTNSSASASSANGPASLTAVICDGGYLSLSGLTWASSPSLRMFERLRSNGNVQGVPTDRAPNDLSHDLAEGIFNQGHGPNRLANPAAEGIIYQDFFAYQDTNGNGQYDAGTDYASETITLVYRITPKPAAPSVTTNVSTLCNNGSATLTATGCSGWIVWQDVARPGVELQVSRQAPYTFTVSPTQTTTYQAFCQESACNSNMSTPVTITVEQAVKPTNVVASPSTISSTQSVTLTAQGCANTTRWEWNGTSVTGAQLVTTLNQTTVFGVRCVSAAGCQSDTAAITVRFINIAAPVISASKLQICGADSLTLRAEGCPEGSVARWSNNMTGNVIRFVPTANATYYAVCKQGTSEGAQSNKLSITVSPVPAVLGLADTYELGNTISLTATAPGATSYKWIDPQGNTNNGAELKRLGAGMSYAGSYTAVATYSSSCYAYTVVVVRINGTSMTTGAVSPAAVCTGSSVSVPYSSTYTFGASNQFSVLLSDASGSFNNAQVIGTGTSSPITGVVPTTIAAGTGYRVRVVSSAPVSDGETSPTTLTITAAFSVSATSNSSNQQRVVGDTLRLNSTVVPAVNGASYNWRGPNNFSSTQANPVIPGSTTAANGTYTLTVSSPAGCSASAQTSVLLNTDTTRAQRAIRIKAVDSTPKETDLIPRTNGGLGSLNLSVEELDGLDLTGYTYQWSRPVSSTGTTPTTATTPTLTAGKIGEYKVVLTKGVDTLVAYTTLRAKPCKQVAHTYQCGHPATAVGGLDDTGISSLAPGDTIRTGDFDVIVTEINGGGSGGWSGKGYTQVPYLGDTHITVDFTNAKVNDCYEYTGGGVVQSAYNSSWFVNPQPSQDETKGTENPNVSLAKIQDVLVTYSGSDQDKRTIDSYFKSLESQIINDPSLTDEQRTGALANLDSAKTYWSSLKACSSDGGRIAARANDGPACSKQTVLDKLTTLYKQMTTLPIGECVAPPPALTGAEREGQKRVVSGITATNAPIDCFKTYYYFSGATQLLRQKNPTISNWNKGWYTYDEYIKRVGPIITSIAVTTGDVQILRSDFSVSEYTSLFQDFVNSRNVSDEFLKVIAPSYNKYRAGADFTNTGSGRVDPVYIEFDILSLATISELKALVNALPGLAKAAALSSKKAIIAGQIITRLRLAEIGSNGILSKIKWAEARAVNTDILNSIELKSLKFINRMDNPSTGNIVIVKLKGSNWGIISEGIARQSWNGRVNIFKANAEEIAEAATRIKQHRIASNNRTGGNYGYIEGRVDDLLVSNKMWRSAASEPHEPQIFTAIEVEGSRGRTWLRTTDSEYKMLNQLASDLGGRKGGVYANIKGEIKIVSENPYCVSCQGIIQQFSEMFPNVKLVLVDGAK